MNTFFWRRRRIRRKDEGSFDDPYGPLALATVLTISLATTFVCSLLVTRTFLTQSQATGVVKLFENEYVKTTYFAASHK